MHYFYKQRLLVILKIIFLLGWVIKGLFKIILLNKMCMSCLKIIWNYGKQWDKKLKMSYLNYTHFNQVIDMSLLYNFDHSHVLTKKISLNISKRADSLIYNIPPMQ